MALNPALRRRVAQAQTGIQKDPVFRDGEYIVEIWHARIIDATVTGVGDMYDFKVKVLQARGIMQGVEPNAVGTFVNTKGNLSTNRAATGNMKTHIATILGIADPMALPEEKWNEILDWIFSDQNPLRGYVVSASTFRTIMGPKSKTPGAPFIGVNFKKLDQPPQDVQQRRAAIDQVEPFVPQAQPQQPQFGAPPQQNQQPQQYGAPPQFGGQQQYAPQNQQPPQFGGAPQQPPQFGGAPQQPPQFGGAPQQPQFGGAPQQPQFGGQPQQFGTAPQWSGSNIPY